MNLWNGNNEPFITQNKTARKNKHPPKSTFYQRLVLLKASGVQGTECSASRAKSYSVMPPVPLLPVSLVSSFNHLVEKSFSVF